MKNNEKGPSSATPQKTTRHSKSSQDDEWCAYDLPKWVNILCPLLATELMNRTRHGLNRYGIAYPDPECHEQSYVLNNRPFPPLWQTKNKRKKIGSYGRVHKWLESMWPL